LNTRYDAITGILNGIDTKTWDPARDVYIEKKFSVRKIHKRAKNKCALQKEFNLKVDPEAVLFAVISRLEFQKGIDLIPEAVRQIKSNLSYTSKKWQLIVLGKGNPEIESLMKAFQDEFPGQIRVVFGYDSELSHRLYAGADVLVIPSRYEPCGISQMIAMRYGCIPLARATGGLKDTISPFPDQSPGTGFLFQNPSANSLAVAMMQVLDIYPEIDIWKNLQINAMKQDFSWKKSAREYLEMYFYLLKQKHSKKRKN
jgi:starch synthase